MAEAILVLEDGEVFRGAPFGARGETFGEVVFNTALSGYQEVLTDPSYHGQIVTMTYPHVGNYGVNPEDIESSRVRVDSRFRSWASRSGAGRSSKSTYSPTPSASASSTWQSSTTDAQRYLECHEGERC